MLTGICVFRSPATGGPQVLNAQRRPLSVLKTTEVGTTNEDVSPDICVS